MTIPISGQVTISWDEVSLKIEAPSRNGARQKIEGVLFFDLPLEIRHNLIAQIEGARDRARAELMSVQRNNVQYVADEHNPALARKIWGSDWVESRTLRSRLAKAAGPGQFDPIKQKIVTKVPDKEILDLDL